MNFFSLVSTLIALAAVSSYLNYCYIKLPTTIGVMLVALIASLGLIVAGPYAGGFREQAATLVTHIEFNQVVLHGMLAFLLFAGAIHVKLDELGREWPAISLLAIFATLASTLIVGGAIWLILGWLDLAIPLGWFARRNFGGHGAVASGKRFAQPAVDAYLLRSGVLDPGPGADGGAGDPDERRFADCRRAFSWILTTPWPRNRSANRFYRNLKKRSYQ